MNKIPSPHECNLLSHIRAGYAVQSPKGSKLFEEDKYCDAVDYSKLDNGRYVQAVLLAEQCSRTCQLPIPNGWTTHKLITKGAHK